MGMTGPEYVYIVPIGLAVDMLPGTIDNILTYDLFGGRNASWMVRDSSYFRALFIIGKTNNWNIEGANSTTQAGWTSRPTSSAIRGYIQQLDPRTRR